MPNKKFSILLVEDEENLQEALKLNLELEGYEITSAYDGVEALKAVTKEHFDLLILDVMLPEMDGFEFLVEMRTRAEWRDIPVLVVTAKDLTAEERSKIYAAFK